MAKRKDKKSSKKSSASGKGSQKRKQKRSASSGNGKSRKALSKDNNKKKKKKKKRDEELVYSSAREWAQQEAASDYQVPSLDLPEGVELFRFKEAGTYFLDILPYRAGAGNPRADEGILHFERTFWVHRIPTADGRSRSYVCPARTFDKQCPVCEHVQELRKDPEADEKTVNALGSKKRQLFNVIDLNDKDKGVQVWEYSYHNFGKLLRQELEDPTENNDDFFRLDGSTLKLRVIEESIGSGSFFKVGKIEFKSRKKPYSSDILDEVYCLDELVKEVDYDELYKLINQLDEDDDSEDEPEDSDELEDSGDLDSDEEDEDLDSDDEDEDSESEDSEDDIDPDDDFDDNDSEDDDLDSEDLDEDSDEDLDSDEDFDEDDWEED